MKEREYLKRLVSILRTIYLAPLYFYRYVISPALPRSCIYTPSCSLYVHNAVNSHGIIKGTILGFFRITRCVGGLFTGGEDPVPESYSLRDALHLYKVFWNGKDND